MIGNTQDSRMDNPRITVHIDASLKDLAAKYLANRQRDIDTITGTLKRGDYEPIRAIGHNIKGTGAAYGFDFISEIGDELEQAALQGNGEAINKVTAALADYLRRVDVVFD